MTASNLAIPIGLIILLTFLQVLVPSFLLWNTSKYEDGTAATGKDGMGPRDRMPIVTAIVGRAERAKTNLIESLVMLFPALALALFAGGGTLTLIGVWIFLAARVLYIPCYLYAVFYVRSAMWGGGLLGIVLIWWSALIV